MQALCGAPMINLSSDILEIARCDPTTGCREGRREMINFCRKMKNTAACFSISKS
jgi:hypothetical protein